MAIEELRQDIAKMNKRITRFTWTLLLTTIPIMVLLVGGWARNEANDQSRNKDIVEVKADIDYVRKNAVNIVAFNTHIQQDKTYQDAVSVLIKSKDADVVAAFGIVKKRMDELTDMIMATQTEIIPRGAVVEQNKKLQK